MANRAYSRVASRGFHPDFRGVFLALLSVSVFVLSPSNSTRSSFTNLIGQMASGLQFGHSSSAPQDPASLFQPANLQISGAPSPSVTALLRSLPTFTPPAQKTAVATQSAAPAKVAAVKIAAAVPSINLLKEHHPFVPFEGNPNLIRKLLMGQNQAVNFIWNYDKTTGLVTYTPKFSTVSSGECAHGVVAAFRAAGIAITPNNADAMRPNLLRAGFVQIARPDHFKIGDVMMIAPDKNYPYGHISTYNGTRWVSDFVQEGMWVYSGEAVNTKLYSFYRNPVVAAASDAYMAQQPNYNRPQIAGVTHRHYGTGHTYRHHFEWHRYAAAHHTTAPVAAAAPAQPSVATTPPATTAQISPQQTNREMAAGATAPARPVLYSMNILKNAAYTYA